MTKRTIFSILILLIGVFVFAQDSSYKTVKDIPYQDEALITGDRELEMLGRCEENEYLWRMMKVVGHEESRIYKLDGYGHNIVAPSCPLIINEILRIIEAK